MKQKTNLKCWVPGCNGEVGKELTEGNGDSTKYYYLICSKCNARSPSPWSDSAIKHCEETIMGVENEKS